MHRRESAQYLTECPRVFNASSFTAAFESWRTPSRPEDFLVFVPQKIDFCHVLTFFDEEKNSGWSFSNLMTNRSFDQYVFLLTSASNYLCTKLAFRRFYPIAFRFKLECPSYHPGSIVMEREKNFLWTSVRRWDFRKFAGVITYLGIDKLKPKHIVCGTFILLIRQLLNHRWLL